MDELERNKVVETVLHNARVLASVMAQENDCPTWQDYEIFKKTLEDHEVYDDSTRRQLVEALGL